MCLPPSCLLLVLIRARCCSFISKPLLNTRFSKFNKLNIRRRDLQRFLVKHRESQKSYALKVASKSDPSGHLTLEQQMLQAVAEDGSRFLLKLVASWHDSENYYLLTKWHEGADLASQLSAEGKFSKERAKVYLAQLILALEALLGHRIIHRDVKPANVFLDEEGNIVLGDLGFGKSFPEEPSYVNFEADPDATSGALRWEECISTERWRYTAVHVARSALREYDLFLDAHRKINRSPTARAQRAIFVDNATFEPRLEGFGGGAAPSAWKPRALEVPRSPYPELVAVGDPYAQGTDPLPKFLHVKKDFLKKPEPVPAVPFNTTWLDRIKKVFTSKAQVPSVGAQVADPLQPAAHPASEEHVIVIQRHAPGFQSTGDAESSPRQDEEDLFSQSLQAHLRRLAPEVFQTTACPSITPSLEERTPAPTPPLCPPASRPPPPAPPRSKLACRLSHVRNKFVLDGRDSGLQVPRGRGQRLVDRARSCLASRVIGLAC
ncbi:hypothetical protein DFH09DRAFT_1278206 [Mycena vulgaris]|nr:hypothetical protein DFH09DRAFT_1278206 [Mycena vulgaris]